ELDETEKKLVKLTINNFSLAISNFILNKEINESQREMIFKLGDVIETRFRDNHNHIYRVSKISSILAEAYGFSKEEIDLITLTATLHDIGKISIPDEILLKPGKLTFEEFEEMKKHSINGYNMINVNNKSSVFSVAGEIALHHHEKWNGLGYPDKLKGEEISKFSRIVSVADVFDALAHKRAYKDAWSIEEIKAFMLEEKGESFQPLIVDLLLENMEKILKILEEYPSY
ncbi:MAG: HD domain-containing protein, partial [Bacillota bacterium]|nr:HD domain-containing protein [Bacillota bacterium]